MGHGRIDICVTSALPRNPTERPALLLPLVSLPLVVWVAVVVYLRKGPVWKVPNTLST